MMSCLTTFSMASMRSTENPALDRMVLRADLGILPRADQASQTASSTSSHLRYLFASVQTAPISGAGVAFDHVRCDLSGSKRDDNSRGERLSTNRAPLGFKGLLYNERLIR